MKKVILFFCFSMFSLVASAGQLPKEVSDDFLKVNTIQLVMQMYPQTMYKIDLMSSVREMDQGEEWASGFVYLSMADASCTLVASTAYSKTCSDVNSCVVQGEAMNLPNCDLRSTKNLAQVLKRIKSGQGRFVLSKRCSPNRTQCQTQWVKR